MWTILKINLAIGLLATFVCGDLREILFDLSDRKQLIDGIFDAEVFPFAQGGFSSVYRGVNMIDNSKVALKFTNISQKESSEREYEMFSYLNAVDKPKVQQYGIPPIIYYNRKFSDEHTLTVYPLYEYDMRYVLRLGEWDSIDSLILLRDFVRQSKYIHLRGVRHDDIKTDNFMIHNGRTYLIDFNIAAKLNDTTKYGSSIYASRKRHRNEIRTFMCDWESFVYTLCEINRVPLEWFKPEHQNADAKEKHKIFAEFKENTTETIKLIEERIRCEQLKEVMVEFAHETFKDDGSLPRYDYFEGKILEKIQMLNQDEDNLMLFRWLAYDERQKAIKELHDNPPATASMIDQPKSSYLASDYKTPEIDHFEKHRAEMAEKASKNHERFLREEQQKKDRAAQAAREREMQRQQAEEARQKEEKRNKGMKKFVPSWMKKK